VVGSATIHSPPFTEYSARTMFERASLARKNDVHFRARGVSGKVPDFWRAVVDEEALAFKSRRQRLLGRVRRRVGGRDPHDVFTVGKRSRVPTVVAVAQFVAQQLPIGFLDGHGFR